MSLHRTSASQRLAPGRRRSYLRRYAAAEWRATVFADMILDDLRDIGMSGTILDIGCGSGFDGATELQGKIATHCKDYIGVEPDHHASIAPHFTRVHRALFENAWIEPASVDLAFAVMVIEHVTDPDGFMRKLATILKDGGVFWAFTVDSRHWSAWSSLLLEKLKLKDAYLNALHGRRGEQRYANFPVHYRLNSPRRIARHAAGFVGLDFINLSRVGAEDYNLPSPVRPLNRLTDRLLQAASLPGSNLCFRLVRGTRDGNGTGELRP